MCGTGDAVILTVVLVAVGVGGCEEGVAEFDEVCDGVGMSDGVGVSDAEELGATGAIATDRLPSARAPTASSNRGISAKG
jgi:hypothetical protein